MFKIYDRYMFRQLMISTLIVTMGLSMIILLTQSLKLIELVLQSSASVDTFFGLMALSLPRFIEAVMPASVLISTLFIFHRLNMDSELVILRAGGASPFRIMRPVLATSVVLGIVLLLLSLWVSPMGIYRMQALRKEVKAHYAQLLFREGIFNPVGDNLTAYVRQQSADGRLVGLMVHDTRTVQSGGPAVTVVARSGQMISDDAGQRIIVYDGARQELNPITKKFSQLNFQQYTLDIPTGRDAVDVRWREPDERTYKELTDPTILAKDTPEQRMNFRAELHRRIATPLLMLSFAILASLSLVLGPFSRHGQMPLLGAAALLALTQQGLFLFAFNVAKKSPVACYSLYVIAIVPICIMVFLLTPPGERLLARMGRAWRQFFHQPDQQR